MELLLTSLVVVFLWITMVRIFDIRISAAKQIACNAQVREIQAQIEIYQLHTNRRFGNQEELDAFVENWKPYFQAPPHCPFGWPYTIHVKTGLLDRHDHSP